MRSNIIIERRHGPDDKGKLHYVMSAHGKFGGGYSGRHVTADIEQITAIVATAIMGYGRSNPEGYDLICPADIRAALPESLRQ